MGDRDIAKAIATVLDAAGSVANVTAVGCDSEATEPVRVQSLEDIRDALRGGGGTDMRVGLAKAAESQPDAIVCVTDGETPWPHEAPEGIPIIVVLTREYSAPSWAETILATD
jgi:predicted metal-dependent peptidase